MKRRNFLISPSALALGAAAGSIAPSLALAAPAIITPQSRILPRQGKGPRIVICGGGWGYGSTAGVWAMSWYDSRAASNAGVGFRSALYL